MSNHHEKIFLEIVGAFKSLTEKIEVLLAAEHAQDSKPVTVKPETKPVAQKPESMTGNGKAITKDEVKSKVVKKGAAKKTQNVKQEINSAEQVLNIIKSAKKSIDLEALKEKTGFNPGRLNTILYRLIKDNKIKRLSKGVYAKN